jgi:hypothetical protein
VTFEGRESPDRGEVGECSKCAVTTYPGWMWTKMTREQRRVTGGRLKQGDFCERCARGRAQVEVDPEPGEEFVEPECKTCGAPMITRSHWKKAGEAERAELLEEGYRVIHSISSGECRRCHDTTKAGTP